MKYIILIFIMAFTSCTNEFQSNCTNSVKVEFVNNRDNPSTLTFSNGQDSISLDSKETSKPLCFSKKIKTDGQYIVKIKELNKDTLIYWGYYTNGLPLENLIKITLEKDSINIKGEGTDFY